MAAEKKEQTPATETEQKQRFSINPEVSFSVTEAYKALRTNINFSIPGTGNKSFLVTSAVLSEGKTTTSTSLALTIAQTDAKVIIVDGDLRRPKVHTKFNVTNKIGLSNILSGMCTLQQAVQKLDGLTLDVISAGSLPPNPAELLSSQQMADLVEQLKAEYDYVIIDTPPVDIVADALTLTKLVDGVVLVVRYQQSMHPEVKDAIERLEFADARILGFVLNGVEETTTYYRGHYKRYGRRYGYSRYGYSYGYGSSDKKKKGKEKKAEPSEQPPAEPTENAE